MIRLRESSVHLIVKIGAVAVVACLGLSSCSTGDTHTTTADASELPPMPIGLISRNSDVDAVGFMAANDKTAIELDTALDIMARDAMIANGFDVVEEDIDLPPVTVVLPSHVVLTSEMPANWTVERLAYQADSTLDSVTQRARGDSEPILHAGSSQTCALNDGTLTCWGSLQADTNGEFSAFSVGHHVTCGLHLDGSVTCWSLSGEDLSPVGTFIDVVAGGKFSCGVRLHGFVDCWSSNGQWIAPNTSHIVFGDHTEYMGIGLTPVDDEGDTLGLYRFSEISVGYDHACGILNDRTVACWGTYFDEPSGAFDSIASGWQYSCGIRTDRTLDCWGGRGIVAPGGTFSDLAVNRSRSCGIRTDGTVTCWGELDSSPGGTFSAIAVGWTHTCGIRTDQTVTCWGAIGDAPKGEFVSITAGAVHSCGTYTDRTVVCWGANDFGQTDVPDSVGAS